MSKLDDLDKLFIAWAFLFQIILIIHFALRKRFFESYTVKSGWVSIPCAFQPRSSA